MNLRVPGPAARDAARAATFVARTIEVVRAGTIGAPRTLDLTWTVANEEEPVSVAGGLIDVACALLESEVVALYAVACSVDGPPLLKINVLTENGAIATIEVIGDSDLLPARADLYLFGTDGEIDYRHAYGNALWSDGRRRSLPDAPSLAESQARDEAAMERQRAVAHALERSLSTGETVDVREVG